MIIPKKMSARHIIQCIFMFLFKYWSVILKAGIFASLFGVFFIVGMFIYYAKELPSAGSLQNLSVAQSTKIFDRTGQVLLYDVHGTEKRTIISLEQIPDSLKYATVIAEDDEFYRHFGIDFKGIGRAIFANLVNADIKQGGSTITQQFVKNAFLTPERTLPRKIKEIILTLQLELKYEKDEILEFYLNQVPYGSNIYGVEAAARAYFGKPARKLTLAESASLAALPKAPTFYLNNPDQLKARRDFILKRMRSFDYIREKELASALQDSAPLKESPQTGIKAPHFVMYVTKYLETTYGPNFIRGSGLNVYTTLDWEMQEIAEELVVEYARRNEKWFGGENAALAALDPKTGQILTMVGSRDYFDETIDGQVNVALRPRQPGSSFKPFAYAEAIKKGYSPETIVFDVQTEFNPNCDPDGSQEKDQYGLDCYSPQNYDQKYIGPVTIKSALAQSRNVPSVKVLYLAGLKDTIDLARKMGVASLGESSRYGLSLVLGGGEVTLLEETSAYGAFAAEGILHPPAAILKIQDQKGRVLEEYQKEPSRVLEKNIARRITSILSDNELRAPMFGQENYLSFNDLSAAAKTGTTQKYRDAWTVGYTPSLAVGVWAGNNDNQKMYNAPGSQAAAPLWHEFIRRAYEAKEELKQEEFPEVQSISNQKQPTPVNSILYRRGFTNDSQYENWEIAIEKWRKKNEGLLNQDESSGSTPKESEFSEQ